MKNITLRFGTSILLMFSTIFTACNKNNKGVIEVHKYNLDFEGDKVEGTDTYSCYIVSEKSISLNDGELVSTSEEIYGYSTIVSEYVYWESESAKSLGYTVKIKDESGENILGYNTKKIRFVADNYSKPGVNGYWGNLGIGNFSANDIAGRWKHNNSGLEIQINSGNSGHATVIEPGTAFPAEADGGQCMIDINYQGNGEWTGMYRTYYPGSGWQNSNTVYFYMESDKQSFTLGGATYQKI
jgi:hypothetical protein